MKIIVNDTNIFIDLHSVVLLEALCDLPYDIRTVDFVVNEVTNHAQAEALEVMINEGKSREG